jgi:hypothetical protein
MIRYIKKLMSTPRNNLKRLTSLIQDPDFLDSNYEVDGFNMVLRLSVPFNINLKDLENSSNVHICGDEVIEQVQAKLKARNLTDFEVISTKVDDLVIQNGSKRGVAHLKVIVRG